MDVVASFAAQAGVALELAASRAEAERLSLYEDRDRIARDLHDLVIQPGQQRGRRTRLPNCRRRAGAAYGIGRPASLCS